MLFNRRALERFDWPLLAVIIALPLVALVVLYSAGFDPESEGVGIEWLNLQVQSMPAVRQAAYLCVGIVLLLLTSCLPTPLLQRWSYVIYLLGIIALIGLAVFGQVSHGSRRWYALGVINFQPSELMKLGVILALARYLSKSPPRRDNGYSFFELFPIFGLFLLPMMLIIQQPDLGTALAVGAVGFGMVMFMGIQLRPLLYMFVTLVVAMGPLWFVLEPYQQRRVIALFNPEADPLGSGYHIIQSKIAVGSGSLLGRGFREGTQTQLEFVPERTTDFIFSVLAEEWGFLGAAVVLTLYLLLLYLLLRVARRSRDPFGCLLAVGAAIMIFFHVFVNVGMVLGVLPVVGLPLPLFSYGGSALMTTFVILGLALGVSWRRSTFERGGDARRMR